MEVPTSDEDLKKKSDEELKKKKFEEQMHPSTSKFCATTVQQWKY